MDIRPIRPIRPSDEPALRALCLDTTPLRREQSERFVIWFILAAIALCLCLFSCGSQPEETNTTGEITTVETSIATTTTIPTTAAPEPQPWYEAMKEYVFGCQIDEQGNMYYTDGEKIWRYDMNTNEAEFITEGRVFSIDGDYLYYVTASRVIMRAFLDDLEKKEVLLTAQQLGINDNDMLFEEFQDYLRRIELHKNILVVQWHAALLVAYDLNQGRIYRLTTGVGSQGFAVTDEYIYFSEWREFRVFRVPLRSLGQKPEMVLGTEEGWWDNRGNVTLYDEFAAVHGQLYFTQRTPKWLWRFNENGNHKLIYDFTGSGGKCDYLFAADDKLYFDWSIGITAAECRVLYCYDPKTGEMTIACDDDEFSNSYGNYIRILRDRVFFVKEPDSSEREIFSAPLK